MSDQKSKIEVASYKGRRLHPVLKVFLALVLLGALAFGTLFGLVLSGAHDDVNGNPQIMIVLGCQLHEWGPSVLLQDRLNRALDYWKDHPDMIIVVSGGQGDNEPTSEARGMADYLIAHGVEEDHILLEDRSHNTNQNLRYSISLIAEEGYDPTDDIMVVSNGFHLTRVRMLWDRAASDNLSTLAAPTSHFPSRLKMYIREPIALVKSFVLDR